MTGELSALQSWQQALLSCMVFAVISAAVIFTGFLSSKKHSKPALIPIILLTGTGIYYLISGISAHYYYATTALTIVYSAIALAAWITDNRKLKIIRIILAALYALMTLYFTAAFLIMFIQTVKK